MPIRAKKQRKTKKGIKHIKISRFDAIWSKLVRERDGKCRNCGKKDNLNAHHIHPRGRKSTRLVLENGISLCAGCHVFSPDSVHRSPEGSKAFCVKLIGLKEYIRLEKMSNQTMSERDAIKDFLTKYSPK